jgi:ribosomal protein S27AE
MMTCRVCGEQKLPEQMKLHLGRPAATCKSCDAEKSRDYYAKHKAERAAFNASYRKRESAIASERAREQRRRADPQFLASERARHRVARQSESGRTRNREYQRIYADKKSLKVAAHVAVRAALRTGRLVRPDACERCGASLPLHAHHDDYSRQLVVRWVCPPCHKALHAEIGEGANG